MNNSETFDYIAKVILIGETNVGKTNILTRYCKDEFKSDSPATVGIEFSYKIVKKEEKTIKLQIWDTAGQEKFRAITNSFYMNSSAAFVVFDLAKYSSFEKINHWISELKQYAGNDVEILVIGNKCDLKELRAINFEEAKSMCSNYSKFIFNQDVDYIETSALIGHNIIEAFDIIIESNKDLTKKSIRSLRK
jgi:small GTP-binding protein